MARILVFAFDLTESSQIRRIKSLRLLGHDVDSAAFQRANMNSDFVPDWPNIDLGFVANQRPGKRMIGIVRGIWRVMWQRGMRKRPDVVIARNLDLLVIAWATRFLSGAGNVPLVYECLDIHGLMTEPGVIGRVMRWCERRLLARVQLLIVSSPGFIAHYFDAIQGYDGPYSILENKLWFDDNPTPRPGPRVSKTSDDGLTLGWVGSIRCAPSLSLLLQTADHFGDAVKIAIHGNVHRHVLPDFNEQIGGRANITYFGPYAYPDGLAAVYASCDIVWAQDLWQRGANSDWLLPNRIYEASWFGCPCVAVAGTETGRKVARDGLGFTIDEPSAKALIDLLERLNGDMIKAVSDGLLARGDGDFVLRPTDVQAAFAPVMAL